MACDKLGVKQSHFFGLKRLREFSSSASDKSSKKKGKDKQQQSKVAAL